jgi:hypothetical protein
MPKGLKASSEIIAISTSITEAVAGTMATETIELSLSPLDNQVFVITKIDAQLGSPELIAGTECSVTATLSSTARTTIGDLSDNDVIGFFSRQVNAAPGLTTSVNTNDAHPDQPSPGMEYLAVIFTNDMFLNVRGVNNVAVKGATARIWGFRATASPSIYAAGVQAELLG